MTKFATWMIICSAAAFLAPSAITGMASRFASSRIDERGSCVIKGNISIETGEHIYHVPGQKYYVPTRISPEYGERWFCSESDARAAGWRKSRQ